MKESPVFGRAAVAAPHHLAAASGQAVLAQGGNAIEAMVAMAASIAVVYPHMNSIGGDGFWLVREPGGRVRGIEACGYAGQKATIDLYRENGFGAIPPRGPDAAVTVAGAVGGWELALELSQALGGRLPLDVILGDAIGHAKQGYGVSASEAREEAKEIALTKAAPGFLDFFYKDGERYKAGEIRKAPALGAVLEHLAAAGLDDFYRGDVGHEIAADLERIGAPVTRADLERFQAVLREPLSLRLEGATVYNLPPPTQGLASLIILGLFERLGVKHGETFEHAHGLVEATKRAFRVRDRVVTDFDHLDEDPARYLGGAFLNAEAGGISMGRAAAFPMQAGDGDTVWMGAIDGDGLAVSYIQSLYWEYGSGCVLPKTGIHWQNRGVSFSLDPRAKNPLLPGRRPFHTLNPALAVMDDGRVVAYGAMGGDGQPQFQAQIFTRWRNFGQSVAEAVAAPRFLLGKTWGDNSASLKLERAFDDTIAAHLRRVGHEVEINAKAHSDDFGHAGMLVRQVRGYVEADHDPRSDGGAAGI